MSDPTLTRFSADFGYTSSDKYSMTVGFRTGTGPKPSTANQALLEALRELVRIGALFELDGEMQEQIDDALKAVTEWRNGRFMQGSRA